MVKKKLVALGISVAAVTAVVGAGFAGWTFDAEAKQEHNLGINITAAYSFGQVTVDTDQPDTVVLDQSGVTLAKSGALDTAIANVTAKWTVNTVSYTDAVGAGLTYTVNVYVNTALTTYVNCGDTAAETDSAKTGYTQYKMTVTPAEGDITTDGDDTVVTMTLANPLVYTASKPDTFEKYQAMVAELTSTDTNTVEAGTVVTDTEYDVASTAAPVIIEFVVNKTVA